MMNNDERKTLREQLMERYTKDSIVARCYDSDVFQTVYNHSFSSLAKYEVIDQLIDYAIKNEHLSELRLLLSLPAEIDEIEREEKNLRQENSDPLAPTTHHADLEIRIREKGTKQFEGKSFEGHDIEFTVDNEQQFEGGFLNTTEPWISSASPKEDGERLFGWLFANDQLKQDWANIRGQYPHRRLRLRIDPGASELNVLPWELLREPNSRQVSQTLAADDETPFSRYIASNLKAAEPINHQPIKMLVAIASPSGLDDFNLAKIDMGYETYLIEKALDDVDVGDVAVTFLPAPATFSKLVDTMNDIQPDILHIIAHGVMSKRQNSANLFLAKDDNTIDRIDENRWADALASMEILPHFIFFACCHSADHKSTTAFQGFAPLSVKAGVPAVLAMQDAVPVVTAQAFTGTFYRQLLKHGQIDVACNQARATLMTADLPGSSIPVLYSRLKDNQLIQRHQAQASPQQESHQSTPQKQPNADATEILLDILLEIPALEDQDNRTLLLKKFPTQPKSYIRRSSAVATDLANIIDSVASWGKLATGEWGLVILAKEARHLSKGTELETKINHWLETYR
ncbi:MAG: CHAT domain-containing protein [Chloroflexota bacterium]